jgi:hypothetical protein
MLMIRNIMFKIILNLIIGLIIILIINIIIQIIIGKLYKIIMIGEIVVVGIKRKLKTKKF